MIHARPDYNRIQDPLGLIPKDEPVFLLRAIDAAAPAIVDAWAGLAEAYGAKKDIVDAARNQAKAMRLWQSNNGSKIPDLRECGACGDACVNKPNGCQLKNDSMPVVIGLDMATGKDSSFVGTLHVSDTGMRLWQSNKEE